MIRACNIIDLIIEILRGSKDRNMVKNCLTSGMTDGIKFRSKESSVMAQQLNFTERQANAILDMRLYKLIGLEIDALIKENKETNANIYRYEDILDRRDSMAQVIIQELDALKKSMQRNAKHRLKMRRKLSMRKRSLRRWTLCFLWTSLVIAKQLI